MLDGYQPGDPVVAVFTYQADPAGRTAEEIADEAFDIFNDHPRDPDGADLACAYYGRRLRSLRSATSWLRRRGRAGGRPARRLGAGQRPADRGPHPRARHPPPAGTRPLLVPGARPAPAQRKEG